MLKFHWNWYVSTLTNYIFSTGLMCTAFLDYLWSDVVGIQFKYTIPPVCWQLVVISKPHMSTTKIGNSGVRNSGA